MLKIRGGVAAWASELSAIALASRGANVAINCNTGGELAQKVREEIRGMGRNAECYAHNVADEAEVQKMHDEILGDFGQVDILVNNAGITRDKSFKKMTREMWDDVIGVDLTGVFLVTKQFIDPMAERGWGRMEWAVVDWNTRAADFYERQGAGRMNDWTVFRWDGPALHHAARR